jgi:hypothetical protein
MIDSAFAFEMTAGSAGWVEAMDVETGEPRTLSRRALRQLAARVREWQDEVKRASTELDLDVVCMSLNDTQTGIALGEFVAERRLRKMRS